MAGRAGAWQDPGAHGIHRRAIGLLRSICLPKALPIPKISLILGVFLLGPPQRTALSGLLSSSITTSFLLNHFPFTDLMGQKILFSARDGETEAMKLHVSKSCIERGACTSLMRHEKKTSPSWRVGSSVRFQREVGQLCRVRLVLDWVRCDNARLAFPGFHRACISKK